ncbi:putative ATP-dependent RNA helicase DDX28 [Araneus ventricosus]|uniref:RNA helicase n=1 Tax=Araneus ventricosus TaxID=182803 RepID=A0A4Y2BJ73_ARAVE|nr:putative ATP-dependent RNA helicase DDX28 [Araneus ventricosus]
MSKSNFISSKNLYLILSRRTSTAQIPLPVPVIKVPKYVEKHVEKAKKKEFFKELSLKNRMKIAYRGDTSIPVISSTIGDYNYYLGQIYNERHPIPLQSKYWFKAKSSGQKFRINPFDTNPSLALPDPNEYVDDVYFPNEFSKMQLNPSIVNALSTDFNFTTPTRIQTLVIPRILTERHILIASETGGGKTISYLAPIIHQLAELKKTVEPLPDTPLAIIVVPGRELAEQIGEVAYRLGSACNVDARVLISDGTKQKHLTLYPNASIDLLVASIGCLNKLFGKKKIFLSNVKHVVLDEADTLLDGSFADDTSYLFQKLMVKSSDFSRFGAQLILSSSVYPTGIDLIFNFELRKQDIVKVCSPYLHRVPPHIEQRFLRVSNDSRAGELLDLIKPDYQKKKPVMIFCNKSPTCDWLSKFLEENDIPNGKYHGGINPVYRTDLFRSFQRGSFDVLVCTDLASRGLDTQRVKHVVNFDFPNNVSDYLLRVGRVGRVGSNHGRVTSLVHSASGVYTVNAIETAVKKAERISGVDSNIKEKIRQLHFTH